MSTTSTPAPSSSDAAAATGSPLAALSAAGVSIWLDDLSRDRLTTGSLAAAVTEQHVVGVTTNPTIFQKAISSSDAYDDQLRDLAVRGVAVDEAVRALTTADVREACDVLRGVYDATDGLDGWVSIEVDPRAAHDTERTVAEARALAWAIDRPNVLIKIPATLAGLPAITRVLAEGISVNVTLIFSLERYQAVIDAFHAGLEAARDAGHDLTRIASVASFFVSRVDTEVDRRLDALGTDRAAALRGQAAIANARAAAHLHTRVMAGERWQALAEAGARPQRPLWASTGVKDPSYDDTRYVVDLATAGTVNTMPEPTLLAVADHGVVRGDQVAGTQAATEDTLAALGEVGVDLDEVVTLLEEQGVASFVASWEELLGQVQAALERASSEG